jgi:signal transduction histidine kinase
VLEAVGERAKSTIGFTLSPVRDGSERIRGAAMFFRDLTPFERMDEQDRLRERLTALGQMAADLAHEIRNPLAGMQVVAGLLRRRLAGRPDEQALVDEIIGELGAVGATVTASLEFVHPVSVERARLDPEELLTEALDTALSRVPFDGRVERSFASGLPALEADGEKLRSVVTNLVVNALEAMREHGGGDEPRLRVSLECVASDRNLRSVRVSSDGGPPSAREAARQELVIGVADTGPGVPDELREKVFYPFFTTKQRGSGIGLAAAQKIVAGHGGIIELEEGRPRGAVFRVRLPVASGAPEAPPAAREGAS